jgi:3-hydroxyacyl-CoA dehydrogenase
MSASYEVRDGVAVITLNNPPVNGLSFETRRAIADGLSKAQDDKAVRAIVLTGGGKAFSAAPTSASSARRSRAPSRTC